MPIPSLTSALRPRSQRHSTKEGPQLESSRPPPADPSASRNASQLSTRTSQSVAPSHLAPVDGSKRRSFLPQPGESRYNARKTSVEDASVGESGQESNVPAMDVPDAQSTRPAQLRPRSLYQVSSSGAHQAPEKSEERNAAGLPPASGRRLEMPQSGLSRSSSLRKPTGSMQAPQAVNLRTHVRTKSTTTVPGARDALADNRTHNGRPKSLLIAPSASTRAAAKISTDLGTRDSARNIALKRSASTRARSATSEADEHMESGQSVYSTQHTLPTYSRRREPAKEEQRKQARPAFSTLQQHFTPRKVGKAPTSMFLHPPVPDSGASSISSEVSSLQAEILQLHLLHQSSTETNRQWEASAKRSLSTKFDEVASMYQVMREEERRSQEQKNIQALRNWGGTDSSFALAEHIHILSGPLHELPSLMDPKGRFRHLTADFDRWVARVEDIRAAREAGSIGKGGELRSADGLGETWKAESATLIRRLTTFLRDLDRLTQPVNGSSIDCIISTSGQFLRGILDELHTMQVIEADIVNQEKQWVEACLRAIAQDIGGYSEIDEGKEAWRK